MSFNVGKTANYGGADVLLDLDKLNAYFKAIDKDLQNLFYMSSPIYQFGSGSQYEYLQSQGDGTWDWASTIGGWNITVDTLYAGTGATYIGLKPGTGIWLGDEAFLTAPFSVDPAGVLHAHSGLIDGLLKLGSIDAPYVAIDGTNKQISSSDYVSGPLGAGWAITTQLAEFQNIRARGKFISATFEKDTISAVGGNLLVADGDILNATMSELDASTMTILGDTTLAVGDLLRMRDGVDDEWFEVTNIGSAPTYTVTRDKAGDYTADNNPKWSKGTAVVNYGASGEGLIFMTASEANSPHIDVLTHAGAPWTTTTTRLRIGNLNGFLDYATDLYGIAIGEADKYLKYDPTNGLQIKGVITATSGSSTGSSNQLLRNGNFEVWTAGTTSAPDGWTGAGVSREGTEVKIGSYSAKLTYASDVEYLYQTAHAEKGINYWKGRTVTLSIWCKTSVGGNKVFLNYYDGVDEEYKYHTGGGDWELLTITRTVNSSATQLRFYLRIRAAGVAYFDGAMLVEGSVAQPFSERNYSETWIHPSDTTKIDGGDIYTGTVTADKITAGTYVGGDFVIGDGGAFKSDNYVADTSGFRLDHTGLELNSGTTILGEGILETIMIYSMLFGN